MRGRVCQRGAGLLALALAVAAPPSTAADDDLSTRLAQARFSRMQAGEVAPPWRVIGLPGQTFPFTRFDIQAQDDGSAVLRIRADASYGNLVFNAGSAQLDPTARLRWRWRLERGLPTSDLRTREGDDAPVKVCALFDMPLGGMSFGEQASLRIARALSSEPLPAATLCYVWDRLLPVGSIVSNAFSARVRYLVVHQGPPRPGQWVSVDRPLADDFLRAFGHETRSLPPLIALAVGADADNTGGSSLAVVGDLLLAQP